MASQDSHFPNPSGKSADTAPMRQHHRLAQGEKISGENNPNGAQTGPTDKKIGNAPKTY